jgi:hypothetical protein
LVTKREWPAKVRTQRPVSSSHRRTLPSQDPEGHGSPVAADSDASDDGPRTGENANALAARRIPQADGLVPTAGDHLVAVRSGANRGYVVPVST